MTRASAVLLALLVGMVAAIGGAWGSMRWAEGAQARAIETTREAAEADLEAAEAEVGRLRADVALLRGRLRRVVLSNRRLQRRLEQAEQTAAEAYDAGFQAGLEQITGGGTIVDGEVVCPDGVGPGGGPCGYGE